MRTPSQQDLAPRLALRNAPRMQRLRAFGVPLAKVGIARLLGPRLGRSFPTSARTFWGDEMRVVLPESLSCEVAGYGYFEAGLTSIMLSCVKPGMVIYDVGAHFGYFTLLAARLVGTNGQVHSFEPTPSTFGVLRENAAGIPNIAVNNVAVWFEETKLPMRDFGPAFSMYNSLFDQPRLPDEAAAGANVKHMVPTIALDSYAVNTKPPAFVKVDAESAELQVLHGMHQLLIAHKPLVTLEVGDFDVDGAPGSRSLLEHVMEYGYEPFEFRDGSIQSHMLRDRYGYDNILLVPKS